jgi:hypothetical protein
LRLLAVRTAGSTVAKGGKNGWAKPVLRSNIGVMFDAIKAQLTVAGEKLVHLRRFL